MGLDYRLKTTGADIGIDDVLLAGLKRRYPTKDVEGELSTMALWLERYPKRRPVNGWRFVDNWLTRAPAVVKPPPVMHAWWTTDERTINQGAAVGLAPRAGETMATFRDRIAAKMRSA